jgi:hypothetical protein
VFQTKVVEKIKPLILYLVTFSENRAVYEIMWKKVVEPEKPQKYVAASHIACWITEAVGKTSEYLILAALT